MAEGLGQYDAERAARRQAVVAEVRAKANESWDSGKGFFTITVGELLNMADLFDHPIPDADKKSFERKSDYMVILKSGSYKRLTMQRMNRDVIKMLDSAKAVINNTQQKLQNGKKD